MLRLCSHTCLEPPRVGADCNLCAYRFGHRWLPLAAPGFTPRMPSNDAADAASPVGTLMKLVTGAAAALRTSGSTPTPNSAPLQLPPSSEWLWRRRDGTWAPTVARRRAGGGALADGSGTSQLTAHLSEEELLAWLRRAWRGEYDGWSPCPALRIAPPSAILDRLPAQNSGPWVPASGRALTAVTPSITRWEALLDEYDAAVRDHPDPERLVKRARGDDAGASHRFLRWDTLVLFPPGDEFASADEVKRGLLAQYRQPMRWRGAVLVEPRRTSAA